MKVGIARPVAGIVTLLVGATIVLVGIVQFRGGFADTVPVTVLSQRAGLVMNPGADVKMRGVTVGKVESITERADGQASIQMAVDAGQVAKIPQNVTVAIASTTVFGAKYVQLIPPDRPATKTMYAGQILSAEQVTVEINTVFQQLITVLSKIEPEKLNETLGAIAAATNGRGDQVGQMLVDLEQFLGKLEPGLPALRTDLALAAPVLNTYADSAQDLVDTARNAAKISKTLVEEQDNLDAMLVSVIGLGDVGNQVLTENRQGLTTVLELLVPTTTLTNEYRESLTCSLNGFAWLSESAPADFPGLGLNASFQFGTEPYRYPDHLPKVAASGGPQCSVLPVDYEERPPFVVADVGANPFERNNQSTTLNIDSLQQALFGSVLGGVGRQEGPR